MFRQGMYNFINANYDQLEFILFHGGLLHLNFRMAAGKPWTVLCVSFFLDDPFGINIQALFSTEHTPAIESFLLHVQTKLKNV